MTERVELADGRAVLYLGDCLEVLPTLEAGSVDAIITDLPYGTTACAWDTVIPFAPMWGQVERLLKPRGAFVTTASQPFTSALGASNLAWLKYSWTWKKSRATGHLNAKKMPMKNTEDVLVFYQEQPTYHPQGVVPCDRVVWNSRSDSLRGVETQPTSVVTGGIRHEQYAQEQTNYPTQIIEIASEGNTAHPTQKPVALYDYLARTYTNEGDTVLDFVMGSGTTGVACIQTGRRFIGIEIEPRYFEIAVRRIEEAALQPRLFDAEPEPEAEQLGLALDDA